MPKPLQSTPLPTELGLGEDRLTGGGGGGGGKGKKGKERKERKKEGKEGKKEGSNFHVIYAISEIIKIKRKPIKKVAFSSIASLHLLFATPPAFFPSAPFRRSPKLKDHLHMDTRSCLTVPKHDGSGYLVFCRWPCVAGDKQGNDASHQDLFPENIKRM